MQQQLVLSSINSANPSLIIFCNGWSMTPSVVGHLAHPAGYDLLHLWDYRESEVSLPNLANYSNIYLVAWSMGVWAAEVYLGNKLKKVIDKAIAITGTPYPVHDEWGIPSLRFNTTLEMLSSLSRERFNTRMCGGKSLKVLHQALSARSTEEVRQELLSVYQNRTNVDPENLQLHWHKALIGTHDRIIPPENQERCWKMLGTAVELHPKEAHYLFDSFSSWEQIIAL